MSPSARLAWAWASAYRLPVSAGFAAMMCAGVYALHQYSFSPLTQVPVRALWFLGLGVALAAMFPLHDALGVLEVGVRQATNRAARTAASTVIVVASLAATGGLDGTKEISRWVVTLAAVGSVIAGARPRWSVPATLAVGMTSIGYEHLSLGSPVSLLFSHMSNVALAAAYGIAQGIFILSPWMLRRPRAG